MQAAAFSVAARDKFNRLDAQGDSAIRSAAQLPAGSITRLPVLTQALGFYSAAWGQAELAIAASPSKDYTAWATRRAAANTKALQLHALIASLVAQQVAA